jgi:hypothetical protein
MRLFAGISLLFLAFAGSFATAQGVPVQSGEHDGFTRLVARIGAGRDWQITRDEAGVIIRFSPDAPDFDVSRIFDLIGRTRLTGIRSEDGLHLSLACPCTVSIERFQSDYAVIDIDDTPYVPDTPPEPVAALPPEPAVDLPLFAGTRAAPALPELAPSPLGPPFSAADGTEPGIDVTEAGNALAEQLARATAAGLLDVAFGMSFEAGDPVRTAPDTPPEAAEAMPQTPDLAVPPAQAPPPLDMANAFDLRANTRPGRLQPQPSASCISPPGRPAAEWSDGMSFANGIGALRVGLYDDRGQLVPERAALLAEFYLYYGFGAEAAFWLDQMDRPPPFLSGLARYVEYGTHGWLGDFDAREGCYAAMTFWLFLTGPGQDRPDTETSARILASFFALPATLRDLFGPTLARSFITLGADAAALEIRANLNRGGRLGQETLALLDLDLAQASPDNAAFRANASDPPAQVSSVNAVAAMTHRLRAQIDTEGRARAADLLAAEALIFETNPQPDLNGLVHVTALAHALAGNLDPIMQRLNMAMGSDPAAAMPILTDVIDILMDQGQTAQLLILLSSPEFEQFGQFPSPAYRRQVANFFLARGLPDLTREIIMAGGTDRAPDREILSAAFDRISRDTTANSEAEPPAIFADMTPPVTASNADEITTLLSRSRDMRAVVETLLTPAMPGS